MAERFRPERFVIAPSFIEWLVKEHLRITTIERSADGGVSIELEPDDWEETTEVEVEPPKLADTDH